MSEASRVPGRIAAYVLLVFATLFWSGNWVAGRMLAGLVPPVALTFWRWVITLAAVMLRDPFSRAAAAGVTLSLAGALAIVTRLDASMVATLGFNAGDLLVIASLVLLAGYTLALRWRPKGLDALSFLACFALVAMVPVGLAHGIERAAGERVVLNATSVAGLLFVAIFPALLAYHFWNLGVAAIGAARAGVFIHLMPVFGSLLGVMLLGERFGLHHAFGMALIFAGVAVATRGKRES